jgi:NTP pyrophosphatase (non-canonical NTP hydrolase)
MPVGMDEVEELRRLQREFVHERDWEQFHTPKNVAMALGGELGELAEAISRLKCDDLSAGYDASTQVSDEVGDVTLYLLRLHDLLDVPVPISGDPVGDELSGRELAILFNAVFKLISSVGRVLEVFQWTVDGVGLDTDASQRAADRLVEADRDLLSVCGLLSINPIVAATAKLGKNRRKYPVETSRGTSRKYTEFEG